MNLLNNSFYAVKALPEKWVRLEVREDEGMIEIALIDSGGGIPPSVANKIMEPFFTTKPQGEGTGIGLSISHSILKEHHGKLELDRTHPHTCFRMSLPIVQPAHVEATYLSFSSKDKKAA